MPDVRIKDLPSGTPTATKRLPMDLTTAESATIQDIVFAGRPAASQAEAEEGTNSIKVMTPLTTAQAIAVRVGSEIDSRIGTLPGTIAAGDDERITGAAQRSVYDPYNQATDAFDSVNHGYSLAVTGASIRSTAKRLRDTYHIKDFGAALDGSTDDFNAFQKAVDFVSGSINSAKVIFSDGIGVTSGTINLAKSNAMWMADGGFRLRHTGSGNALKFDAGPTDNVWNLYADGFVVETPATADNAVVIRAIHHSEIEGLNVRGCNPTKAAIYWEFGVCTILRRPIVSLNEAPWYNGGQPLYALHINNRPGSVDPSPVSFCRVENPVFEHTAYGCYMENSLGVRIIDGTMEGHTSGGIIIGPDSLHNIIDHVDFEANNGFDVFLQGYENELINVSSLGTLRDGSGPNDGLLLSASARKNRITGGTYNGILCNPGSFDNAFIGVHYNRYNNVATPFNDQGTRNKKLAIYDLAATAWHDELPAQIALAPPASPGSGYYEHVNDTANAYRLVVSGGPVTGIVIYAATGASVGSGVSSGMFWLLPNEKVRVFYTGAAPTITVQKG